MSLKKPSKKLKMDKNNPIGVFDSGLGGLTVVKEIAKLLPNENIIYLGDTARVPYGTRSKETVTKFSFEDANFLLGNGVKCIVVACNTASAFAGGELKEKLSVPVFDVIKPALADARSITKNNKVGVIGTRGTIASGAYKVEFSKACPLLVPFIEEGELESPSLKLILEDYISYFKDKDIDTLIIGCTHYPIISGLIEKEIDNNIKIVNPGISVAGELKNYLIDKNLLNNQRNRGEIKFYVTDYTDRFIKVAEMFLGERIRGKIEKVNL